MQLSLMTANNRQSHRIAPPIRRLLLMQFIVGLTLTAAFSLWKWSAGYSALVGATIGFLPNAYLAMRVYDLSKGRSAIATLRAFYVGIAGKFIVTTALFLATFLLVSPLHAPALFGTFIAVQLVNWAALLMSSKPVESKSTPE